MTEPTNEHIIDLNHIYKNFGDHAALSDINLYIRKNEFITLLGPSGCGKTTLLRIIGGFETADKGEVIFNGKNIDDLPPHKRAVNTVFQKYALFTHMNVYENIAFGLRVKKLPKAEIDEKVHAMLELVGLKGYDKRSVNTMSGGQQQRVAIARALVNQPQVLLLDEPLGALDLKLRKEMQIELKKMQQRVGITFIYVTHDQEEALTMSDTIVVMNHGKIQQIGNPVDIYNEPKNRFVASFIGESNIIDGVMPEDKLVLIENVPFKCVDSGFLPGEDVDVVIRPEDLIMTAGGEGPLAGTVNTVTFKGVHYEHLIKDDLGFTWMAQSTVCFPEGTRVGLDVLPENIQIMKKGDAGI